MEAAQSPANTPPLHDKVLSEGQGVLRTMIATHTHTHTHTLLNPNLLRMNSHTPQQIPHLPPHTHTQHNTTQRTLTDELKTLTHSSSGPAYATPHTHTGEMRVSLHTHTVRMS